jgi:hypothetical protein
MLMNNIIYAKNGLWWRAPEGMTLEEAKKIEGSFNHRVFDGAFGPQTLAAHDRPDDFYKLVPADQWLVDKRLGILDWSGEPNE